MSSNNKTIVQNEADPVVESIKLRSMMRFISIIDFDFESALDISLEGYGLKELLQARYPAGEYHCAVFSGDTLRIVSSSCNIASMLESSHPVRDAGFSIVTCWFNPSILDKPTSFLASINRALYLDGLLYIAFPAPSKDFDFSSDLATSLNAKSHWESLIVDFGFVVVRAETLSLDTTCSVGSHIECYWVLRKMKNLDDNKTLGVPSGCDSQVANASPTITFAPVVEKRVIAVLHNLVLFDAIRPLLERFRDELKIVVPAYDSAGFHEMSCETAAEIEKAGFDVQLCSLPANFHCEVELSPYPYLKYPAVNVQGAKWRVRFMYGLAKESWNFSFENNSSYDFVLTYGEYDSSILSAYTRTVPVGNMKLERVINSSRADRPTLLYLPTYGPTSSIEKLAGALLALKPRYRLLVKAHHGTSFLEQNRVILLKQLADEYYDHSTGISQLLAECDVVLSDGSGAVFDSVAAGVPVVAYLSSYFAGLGSVESLEERLIKEGLIHTTDDPLKIESAVARAIHDGVGAQKNLQQMLFCRVGADAVQHAEGFLRELLSTENIAHAAYRAARQKIKEQLNRGMVERTARSVAEKQLQDAYAVIVDRLVETANASSRKEGSLTAQVIHLERQLAENDQRLEDGERLLSESTSQVKLYAERVGEQDAVIISLRKELQEYKVKAVEVSDWARSIESAPISYGLRKIVSKLARSIWKRLPFGPGTKQKIKGTLARFNSAKRTTIAVREDSYSRETEIPIELRINAKRDIFVFAVIDWHFRIQRPQHLAKSLAKNGARVFYFSNHFIDSDEPGYQIETLDPLTDLHQVKLHASGAPAIYFSPPSPATLQQLQEGIAKFVIDFGSTSSVSLIQHAYWYPLVIKLPNSYRVYDCMDHHEGFGNVPESLIAIEKTMLHNADLVVVTSSWLNDFASNYNRNVVVVRNAGEYEFFSKQPASVFADERARRIIGYYGAIAEWFDVELVRMVAEANPDALVLLIGNDTIGAASKLKNTHNISFVGEVPYASLPYYLYSFDVCLLPFLVSPLTLATNPVKIYEYLAAGKPVVSVDLPEIAQFGSLVRCSSSIDDFLRNVHECLQGTDLPKAIAARQSFAREQSWGRRAESLEIALDCLKFPKVSVVVLTFNNLDLTKACLDSLLNCSDYPNVEIIIVDNASTDGTQSYLEDLKQTHEDIVLILNDVNLGFAAGNNAGLRCASGDFIVLLNNDTVVTPGWILTMVRHMQADPLVGLVGPVTNNIGNEAKIDINYANTDEMMRLSRLYTVPHMGQHISIKTAAFFCVMLTRHVLEKVGFLDEMFGRGFFEDDDYCRRVEQQGLKIICAEDVFVHHHLSASFNKLGNQEKHALFEQNKAYYESKWGAWSPHIYR